MLLEERFSSYQPRSDSEVRSLWIQDLLIRFDEALHLSSKGPKGCAATYQAEESHETSTASTAMALVR